MAGHAVVTLHGETKYLLFQSPGTEFFKSVELYLGEHLEITEHLAIA